MTSLCVSKELSLFVSLFNMMRTNLYTLAPLVVGITPPGCEDQLSANNDKFQSVLNDIIDFVNERRTYAMDDWAALSMEEPVVSSVSHSPLRPSSVEEVTITANVEAAAGGRSAR